MGKSRVKKARKPVESNPLLARWSTIHGGPRAGISDCETGKVILSVKDGDLASHIVSLHNARLGRYAPKSSARDAGMEQQVHVQATLTLSLPAAWDDEEISCHLRCALGCAFGPDLPGEVNGESPVNFDFQQEAEIYATNDDLASFPQRLRASLLANIATGTRRVTRSIAGMVGARR